MGEGEEWMQPNRQGFLGWVYDKYKYDEANTSGSGFQLFKQQKFVRDFMEFESPYRGLLLFHGLGTGKSCSSIAAAEGFLKHNKKVIVMIPASLQANYRDEIMRCASVGNPSQKSWNYIDSSKTDLPASYKKKFKKIWYPYIDSIPDTSVYRKNIAWVDLTPSEKQEATDTLREIINLKYTFINYNGITKTSLAKYTADFFDDSFIVIDEAHNFISRVVNGGANARNIYKKLMNAYDMKIVLLSGTPIINHPFELSYLLNLARGPINVFECTFLKTVTNIPSLTEIKEMLIENNLIKYIDQCFLIEAEKKFLFSLLMEGFVDNGDGIVKREVWPKTTEEVITDIVNKLSQQFKVSKRYKLDEYYSLPGKKSDFNEKFIDASDPLNPKVKNMDLFMRRVLGIISYNRTAGEELFPTVLPKIIEKVSLSDYQFSKYLVARDEERKMERRGKQNSGVLDNKMSVYRAFSRMACNFVFPEKIMRPFPKDLRKSLQAEIDSVAEDSDGDKSSSSEEAVTVTVNAAVVQKKYEESISSALEKINEQRDDILSQGQLAKLYSPKFARIIHHINNNIGKSLVYSQFRTIEGIGILRLSLITAGYIEINVERRNDEWFIVNAEEVLDSQYDNKRFIIFSSDREKASLLLAIYNGDYSGLATEQRTLLNSTYSKNIYGNLCKVFMITQSGAEGISLKNVRSVMITEPFWNMVRMDQVIGRAVRAGSHLELPATERTVQVYIFTSVFTKKQLKENFTLRSLDNEMTSDTHILQIAEKKNVIIEAFLNNLKSSAVDCRTNASVNKLMNFGLKCYAFPIPVDSSDYAYVPNIDNDNQSSTTKHVMKRNIRGRVVSYRNKKYVLVDEYPNKFFDYIAYKDAGILHEVTVTLGK
jgi:superfamily II DNA or RNA helicase